MKKVQNLEDLQGLVKGYIEAVNVDDNIIMYINEEGRYSHPNIGFHIGNLTICGSGVLVNRVEYKDIGDEYVGMTKKITNFWDNRTDEEKAQA
jgi:hypothetical protein